MKENVKFVKLRSGDEFIAEILPAEENPGDVVRFKHPVVFVMGMHDRINMASAFFGLDEDQVIEVEKHDIMFIAKAHEKFIDFYNSQFGSGLVTPDEPKIALPFPRING